MPLYTLDIESYYNSKAGYTLSKLTTEEYARHPDATIHGCGFKRDDGPTVYVQARNLEAVLRAIPWEETTVLGHNLKFDLFFLKSLYPWLPSPRFCVDTLSMARHLHADKSASLGNLAKLYNLPPKGDEVLRTDGKRYLTPDEAQKLGSYCCHDVDLTYQLYQLMKPHFSLFELRLIDMTTKFFIDPILRLNASILEDEISSEVARKDLLLTTINKADLMSNPKFADLLRQAGYTPPVKPSPTAMKDPEVKKKWDLLLGSEGISEAEVTAELMSIYSIPYTYAFGKADRAMKGMLESEDLALKTLAEARVGVKSTINESRAGRMLGIAQRGPFPIDLNYCAAHTSRWGGASKLNIQNLPRGSALRQAIEPPPGHLLVVSDLSAIECRVLAYLAGQQDIIDTFATGGDVYCEMASSLFDRPITKADKKERQLGKTLILGCIAEGELVLTDVGLIPIQKVTVDMRVWDGVKWVNHDGVAYQGEKEVITYEGLTATPDHKVFIADGSTREFRIAADQGLHLACTGDGRTAIRFMDDSESGDTARYQQENICPLPMSVWGRGVHRSVESGNRQNPRVRRMCEATAKDKPQFRSIRQTGRRYNQSVQQSQKSVVPQLRRAGGRVPVQLKAGVHPVRRNQFAPSHVSRSGDRQDKQQRALRAGKLTPCFAQRANKQHAIHKVGNIQWGTIDSISGERFGYIQRNMQVCAPTYRAATPQRDMQFSRRGRRTVVTAGQGQTPTVYGVRGENNDTSGSNQTGGLPISDHKTQSSRIPDQDIRGRASGRKVKTYDILNAGPQHRFTVSDVLVHNCGYSMGWKRFSEYMLFQNNTLLDAELMETIGASSAKFQARYHQDAVKLKPIHIDAERFLIHCTVAKHMVDAYRTKNAQIKGFWKECLCILHSIYSGEQVTFTAPRIVTTSKVGFHAPIGNALRYIDLKQHSDGSWSRSTREGHSYLSGGLVTENLVQWLSRHILAEQAVKLQDLGVKIAFTCHDEIVAVAKEEDAEKTLDLMINIMSQTPTWAPGLPMAAEGGVAANYKEAK